MTWVIAFVTSLFTVVLLLSGSPAFCLPPLVGALLFASAARRKRSAEEARRHREMLAAVHGEKEKP